MVAEYDNIELQLATIIVMVAKYDNIELQLATIIIFMVASVGKHQIYIIVSRRFQPVPQECLHWKLVHLHRF